MAKELVDNETAGYLDVIRESVRDRLKPIVCDRCKATCGLYQFALGRWRCPVCIWDERRELLAVCTHAATTLDSHALHNPESTLLRRLRRRVHQVMRAVTKD